jgi:hypothetical protein
MHKWQFIQGNSLKWFQELVVTMGISLLLCEGIYLKFKWFLCSQWLSGETEVHLFRPTVHANSESEEPFQSII